MSSVEVRVLCQGEGAGRGHVHAQSDVTSAWLGHIRTQKKIIASDWTRIQDGRWKAAIWLDNNSRWQMGVIGQKFKMADGTGPGWINDAMSTKRQTSLGGIFLSFLAIGNISKGNKYLEISEFKSELTPWWGVNDNKTWFGLKVWFIIVTSVTSCLCGVSLCTNALVAGNGSYILWPLMPLTLGYDSTDLLVSE